MDYLPLFFDLRGRPVLVVGGHEAAARKLRLLLKAGAAVTVIAADVAPEIADLAAAGRVQHRQRIFEPSDLEGVAAVFAAATNDLDICAGVAAAARTAGVPVNVVDRPELSSFIVPAIVDRDPIVVAISSAGTSPILARTIRARIEALLPSGLGALARFAGQFRKAAHALLAGEAARRRFWERFLESPAAIAVLAGDEAAARSAMLPLLNRADDEAERGAIYLVGAGPGDPDLLTLRALRLMQQADMVVFDAGITPEILDRVRRDAERLDASVLAEPELNAAMLRGARAGKRVLRLSFGRGGEGEGADYFGRHGIEVLSVPGVAPREKARPLKVAS